jgi:ketosteroid isomerase-like protein
VSEENVRLASDAVAAFNDDGVEALLSYFDPSVEWITPPDWMEDRVLIGHDGVRTVMAYIGEQLDAFRISLERTIDLGDDRVVVLAYQYGRIRGTDRELRQEVANLVTFHCGKVTRVEAYFSWDEALKAVGLEK